ncbi:MAG TPA: ABC transporter permease [Ohtaekwangia sp.]|nr:ABC transporter permease [Ohtaekwangia sp.]
MFRNYLKIAIRNLFRARVYSIINISGLSLGVACCLLLTLYVKDELEYDQHHERLNDLYRINTQFEGVVGFDKLPSVSPPIPMTVKDELPEIEAATRIVASFSSVNLIEHEDNKFYESNAYVADSTLFDVLTYEFKEGNPQKALTDANTVVISEPVAQKLFGDEPALNKMILITQGGEPVNHKITGVFVPGKSFLNASFFTSMMGEGTGEYIRTNPQAASEWAGQNFVGGYIRLSPGHSRESVERKINEVLIKYGSEDLKALGIKKTLFIEPVKDIYLKSQVDKNQRITYIYVIVSIAVFVLILACINFMNLSTAKASKRSAEIGIRKVMGAYRSSLIRQILGEAMMIVAISILISIILVSAALPVFNELSGKNISFSSDNVAFFAIALAVLTIVTGLIAGSYPAFYMSSFQPAEVLKGKFTLSNTSGKFRQVLVVFQFVVAIVLVSGMLVISRQISFMKEKNLGFDPEAKILLPLRTADAKGKYTSLKTTLEQLSSIGGVSATDCPPGSPIRSDMAFYMSGGNMDNAILNRRNTVDAGYMELLGIKLIAGRSFTDSRESESQRKLIINRASAKKFGVAPERMVGQTLGFDWQGEHYEFEVIGVMEDYNQTSLKDPVIPIIFEIPEESDGYEYMIATISTAAFSETITAIEKVWKDHVPGTPFEYTFLDDSIQKQYHEDQRVSRIISYFAIIAMIICSLGLYGLSSFMAERRLKEIGVRKVMGASVSQIVGMMSKEFVKLVLVAVVIATPVAWYAMSHWLQDFEYKVALNIAFFAYAGLAALMIALLTVSYESLKAANADPARTLRNE